MRRTRKTSAVLAAATSLALVGSGLAFADIIVADGDGDAPIADNNLAFGNVCAGTTATKTVPIAVVKNGNANNSYKNSAVVTIDQQALTGTGLSQAIPTTANTITLPSDWESKSNGIVSAGKVTSTASLVAGAAGTSFSGSITYRGQGTQQGTTSTVLSRSDVMSVTASFVSCDTTPPVITPTVDGTVGNAGWHTSDVTVSWAVTDPESAITSSSGCSTVQINADQAATDYTCTATSAGGTIEKKVTVKRDATPPIVTLGAVTGSSGTNGWLLGNASVVFTASDVGSGLANSAQSSFSVDSTGEGSSLSVESGTVADAAGNSNRATASVNVDKTNPTVAASLNKVAATTGWFNIATGAPTVSFACTAGGSALARCPGSHTFLEGANQGHTGTATSVSSRTGSDSVSGISVDLTAPAISGSDVSAGGWSKTNVSEDFTASDGGSGIPAADEAFTLTASAESASASQPTIVDKIVTDAAGNSRTRTLSAFIDKSGPIVDPVDQAPSAWRNTPLSVEFTAGDSRSGLADQTEASFTLTTSGDSPNAATPVMDSKTVADAVGNTTTRTISAFVDTVKPTSTVTGVQDGAVYTIGSVPTTTCSGSDALSGVASHGTPGGAGTAVGRYTVTCNGATDNAGNTQTDPSAAVSYVVAGLGKFSKNFDGSSVPKAKAGSVLPLGWAITDGTTNYALLSGTAVSSIAVTACTDEAGTTGTESAEVAAGGSGLQLLADNSYQINVKTSSTQTGCRRFTAVMSTTSGNTLTRSVQIQLVK